MKTKNRLAKELIFCKFMVMVEDIIDAFKGMNSFAQQINAAYSTVAAWRGRGSIPHWWWPVIKSKAAFLGIALPDGWEDAVLAKHKRNERPNE